MGKKSLAGRCARGTSALFIITMTTEYVRRVRSCQSTHQKETRGQSGGAWESLASVPERTLNHFQPGVCVCVREFTKVVCSEALHSRLVYNPTRENQSFFEDVMYILRLSCIYFWCVKSQHERTDWFMVMSGLYLMISILSSYIACFLAIATRSGLHYENTIVLVRDVG